MKIKGIIRVGLAVLILAACAPVVPIVPTQTAMPMAGNFAFVLNDQPCETDILDSTTGTLVHYPVSMGEVTPITIPLRLTHEELAAVYGEALAVDFFGLPAKIVPPDNAETMGQAPAGIYTLSMTNGATTHAVTWSDDIITDPLFPEAARFMKLVRYIRGIFQSRPAYQQLPESQAGCA